MDLVMNTSGTLAHRFVLEEILSNLTTSWVMSQSFVHMRAAGYKYGQRLYRLAYHCASTLEFCIIATPPLIVTNLSKPPHYSHPCSVFHTQPHWGASDSHFLPPSKAKKTNDLKNNNSIDFSAPRFLSCGAMPVRRLSLSLITPLELTNDKFR